MPDIPPEALFKAPVSVPSSAGDALLIIPRPCDVPLLSMLSDVLSNRMATPHKANHQA